MTEEFSDEGFEIQKALIGDFIIGFEDLNERMRFILSEIILSNNRTEINFKNVQTLLTGLGAEQLRSKFDSIIFDNFQSFKDLPLANNRLSNKVAELTTIRNSIAHGSFRIGWKNFNAELSNQTFSLRHSRSTKKGYQMRSKILRIDDFKKLNSQLQQLSRCYNLIAVIIRILLIHDRHNKIELAQKHIYTLNEKIDEVKKIDLKYINILN